MAVAYLIAHPDRAAKAVFASPAPLWAGAFSADTVGGLADRLSPDALRETDEILSAPRILAVALLQAVNANVAHALVGDDEADPLRRRLMIAENDAASCPGTPPDAAHANRPGFYANQQTSADADRIPGPRPRLRAIQTPTVIPRGECNFIPSEIAADDAPTLLGDTLVPVAGTGHALVNDQPRRCRDLLLDFLLDRSLAARVWPDRGRSKRFLDDPVGADDGIIHPVAPNPVAFGRACPARFASSWICPALG